MEEGLRRTGYLGLWIGCRLHSRGLNRGRRTENKKGEQSKRVFERPDVNEVGKRTQWRGEQQPQRDTQTGYGKKNVAW